MLNKEEPTAWAMVEPDGHIGDLRINSYDLETPGDYVPNGTPGKPVALYTGSQFHDKVNMTKTQFSSLSSFMNNNTWYEEGKDLGRYTFSSSFIRFSKMSTEEQEEKYPGLSNLIYDVSIGQVNRNADDSFANIAVLWSYVDDIKDLSDYVNIIPDKAWFVRSKKKDEEGYYGWLSDTIDGQVPDYTFSDKASSEFMHFEYRDDALYWCTPLMEPVIGEF